MRLRYGVHRVVEEEADALIYGAVRKIKKHSENDILTPWKEKDRRSHEIYVPSGVPDAANRQGIYHRSINSSRPDLNSREGVARGLHSRTPKVPEQRYTGPSQLNYGPHPHDHYQGRSSLYEFVHGDGDGHDSD